MVSYEYVCILCIINFYLVIPDGGNGVGSVKELAEWNDGVALDTDDVVVLEWWLHPNCCCCSTPCTFETACPGNCCATDGGNITEPQGWEPAEMSTWAQKLKTCAPWSWWI